MNTRKILLRLLALVCAAALILPLAACGGDGGETETSPATETGRETQTEPVTETEPETEPATESETEPATETEPVTEPEPESETERGAESESGAEPVPSFPFPEELGASSVMDFDLALALLQLCAGETAADFESAFAAAGFTVKKTVHFDKGADDRSHTSPFMIGVGSVTVGGETRSAALVSLHGTMGGEWYSNFDFDPNGDATTYAMNFYLAAQDAYDVLSEEFAEGAPDVFLVTGYSRGAAVANLLGVLLNGAYGSENVYDYTFATPRTVLDAEAVGEQPNIFNFVCEGDLVPCLPLAAWGFTRAGTDITLPADPAQVETVAALLDVFSDEDTAIALSIDDYYHLKHSAMGPGLAAAGAPGITTYEVMEQLAGLLISALAGGELDVTPLMTLFSTDYGGLVLGFALLTGGGDLENSAIGNHFPDRYQARILALREAADTE